VLLQLHADVLRDEVDGNHVVAPATQQSSTSCCTFCEPEQEGRYACCNTSIKMVPSELVQVCWFTLPRG
jgi:hypothetical protein